MFSRAGVTQRTGLKIGALLCAVAIFAGACGDGSTDAQTADPAGSSTTPSAAERTDPSSETTSATNPPTTGTMVDTPTSEAEASSETAPPTTEAPEPADSSAAPVESLSFASPSGNISCLMGVDVGVACNISETAWTVDQPAGCDDGDYGNGFELTSSGPSVMCYTDLWWDTEADPVAYGSTHSLGAYSCAVETTGVSCTDGDGQGFTLARAAVEFLPDAGVISTPGVVDGVVIETGSFATPSGNISCVMDDGSGAACYIAEKDWEIDEPANCDGGDYGNGVFLNDERASFDCYSDVWWDMDAQPVDYGTTVENGQFVCVVKASGVTCTNGSGQGFDLSRSAVNRF